MFRQIRFLSLTLVLAAAVSFSFLTSSASSVADDEVEQEAIFYPPPPNFPRIQFLRAYSSHFDAGSEKGGFRDFVFGGVEKESQLVKKPYGLAVYKGAIYVVDARGAGYGVFDFANEQSRFVQPSGRGALRKPINITIDADGKRFITDTSREQIVVFDANDRFLKAFDGPEDSKMVDVAILGDRLYVTDVDRHQVHVLDKVTGETLFTFSEGGDKPGQLHHPTNIAVGPNGTLFVSDTTNFRVQEFGADGEFINAIGEIGTGHGQFARPKGIAVDREGRLYAVDAAFENVQILAADGASLLAFGHPGSSGDSINMPTVVKIDYENVQYFKKYFAPDFDVEYLVVVVSQFGANKVVVFGFGELSE